eukprot:TRINITY_DN11923_c0_g1_i1.p4 TRINITY_DN11923_c0_g1~~TRINITY_DN11923_c0_g1_i1.p4  ORF type:complete len:142 (+),score=27.08 TRINITY_DN11923_c0_g1_i1:100-525(+)
MIRRPPRSTQGVSSAASDVYKRQVHGDWYAFKKASTHAPIAAKPVDSEEKKREEAKLHRVPQFVPPAAVMYTRPPAPPIPAQYYPRVDIPQYPPRQEPMFSQWRPYQSSPRGGYHQFLICCLLYTSPSPRDLSTSRMPSSA